MSNINYKNKRIYLSIVLLGISLIFSYIEAILPINIGYLGVRIGLANIVTIISLKTLGVKYSLIINVLRLLTVGILFGSIVRFIMSAAGFILSFAIMYFMLFVLKSSILSASIYGGAFHNIGQILSLSIIISDMSIIKLVPIYILIGVLTGTFIGVLSDNILKRVEKYINIDTL